MKDPQSLQTAIDCLTTILTGPDDEVLVPGQLTDLVDATIEARTMMLKAAERFGTPQYLIHEDLLWRQASRFRAAFEGHGPVARVHYAFKANPSATVVEVLQDAGVSADVSSGLELELALATGFERILFSGPAKTDDELALAVAHADRVTVHVDSLAELDRLEAAGRQADQIVRAGVRLSLAAHGAWTKFGIPPESLPGFVKRADACQHVELQGIQFHLSWQRTAAGYQATLADLGPILAANAPHNGWRFIDVGGGFYPEGDEAVYPWRTPSGRLRCLLGLAPDGPDDTWDGEVLLHSVVPIETVAEQLLAAFQNVVRPLGEGIELWLEPGRYLANSGVTVLLRVQDVKSAAVAITDGGTNLLGWERLEEEHVPLVNLTRPAIRPRLGRVYGSLCTPHDLWGYSCYGRDLRVGDILALPAQGAYVQTLSQRFIKPLARSVIARRDGRLEQVQAEERFADRYPSGDDFEAVPEIRVRA